MFHYSKLEQVGQEDYSSITIIRAWDERIKTTSGSAGLIIGLYSLTNTPANILFGRLIDRIGYKIPLIAGLIGDALSMFLYSLSRLPFHLALALGMVLRAKEHI